MIRIHISPLPILLTACAALIALLVAQWTDEGQRWHPDAAHPVDPALFETTHYAGDLSGPSSRALTDSALQSSESEEAFAHLNPIAARPLFVPGRRPLAAPEGERDTETVASNISLIGLFQTDRAAGALLLIDGEARRLSLGASAGGFTLQEILDEAVVLISPDGQAIEYRMRRQLPDNPPTERVPDALSEGGAVDDAFED